MVIFCCDRNGAEEEGGSLLGPVQSIIRLDASPPFPTFVLNRSTDAPVARGQQE